MKRSFAIVLILVLVAVVLASVLQTRQFPSTSINDYSASLINHCDFNENEYKKRWLTPGNNSVFVFKQKAIYFDGYSVVYFIICSPAGIAGLFNCNNEDLTCYYVEIRKGLQTYRGTGKLQKFQIMENKIVEVDIEVNAMPAAIGFNKKTFMLSGSVAFSVFENFDAYAESVNSRVG